MKKVMIGILILIPIIILLVVALVSVIVSVNAHIAVEDLQLRYKDSERTVYDLQISLSDATNVNIYDYVSVKILPEKATDKTVEWQIVGDVAYTDTEYEKNRIAYLAKYDPLIAELEREYPNFSTQERINAYNIAKGKYYKDMSLLLDEMASILIGRVRPAVAFVDDHGNEVESNTTGKMMISSYCKFTVRAQAETVSKILTVTVIGYDVERVELSVSEDSSTTLGVGESMRLLASYTPIDSIVNKTKWEVKSGSDVVRVDQNGVVTAIKEGTATVGLLASVYSTESKNQIQYVEGTIDVTVEQKGASALFGERVLTSQRRFTSAELGLVAAVKSIVGASVDSLGNIVMDEGVNRAVITDANGNTLTVEICGADEVVLKNSEFYGSESGYILAVGENVLDLDIEWADMLKTTALENVQWTSSDTSVATVDQNGEVKGVSSGIATVTATVNGKSVSITLNVQKKLTMIQLRTSDASLAIGIARETVFASEKYLDVKIGNAKTANGTLIVVQGQPENATDAELAAFYSNYNFEIVEGKDFAYMDASVRNRVVFTNAMEGLGKQKVVVKVSAKYPKYESMTRFTTEEVALNVVYGVAVRNIDELTQASKDQEAYATAEDNILNPDGKEVWRLQNGDDTYVVRNAKTSKQTYAICFEDNCAYTPEYDENGEIVANVTWSNFIRFYGNVYGNNHMLSAKRGQVDSYLIGISWDGITISNLVMRANDIGDNSEITDAEDTQTFKGNIVDVEYGDDRLVDLRFEYCIFENSSQGVSTYNADIEYDGCIMRNMVQCAMYIPQRIQYDESKDEYRPWYSHIKLNNFICSNTLGTLMSITYESYTVTSGKTGRFVKDDLKANEQYFLDTFYKDGINCVVTQTGFLDAYNWQDIDNAKLIDVGEDGINNAIGTMFGNLVRENSAFNDYRYEADNGKTYVHVAFIVSGIHFSSGIRNAPTYLELDMNDPNYNCFDSTTLKEEKNASSNMAVRLLKTIPIKLYGYKNNAPITPSSTYQLNNALIDRIHNYGKS